MKMTRFSEHQIIKILKEHEAGRETKDFCREHGISRATFYNWKKKYSKTCLTGRQGFRSFTIPGERINPWIMKNQKEFMLKQRESNLILKTLV